MSKNETGETLQTACEVGLIGQLAEEYINSCRTEKPNNEGEAPSKKKAAKFPNVAGFCRYFGIGGSEYETLERSYPEEFDRLRAILEDEALNSELSPTVLSAYLKKRFGYDRSKESEERAEQLKIVFEHDILEDGR